MAYMASPRGTRLFSRDGRGESTSSAEFGRAVSTSAHQHQRDHNHHDYTNIPTGRSSLDSLRNEANRFVPINSSEGTHELRNPPHPSVRTEDGPSYHNARVDAPTLYGRGGLRDREEGERRRSRTTSSSFDQLRDDLVRQGVLYEDRAFPPNNASIYFSRQPPHNRHIEWMRPWVCVHSAFPQKLSDTREVLRCLIRATQRRTTMKHHWKWNEGII